MPRVLNLSAYRFVTLDALPERRQALHEAALALGLKGTILLAEEGINLFVAGLEDGVRRWWTILRRDVAFAGLAAKESWSDEIPFRRLRVRIKREIIRMNQPALQPAAGRAPAVSAHTVVRWLAQGHDDGGRELALLDTRNAFEVDAGTFEGAIDWRLSKFGDFPAALQRHRAQLAGKTIVSFCTGGIRCEKAALALRAAGLDHVFQLDGGVLKYFEETAGAAPRWRGDCFVFDERGALDPALHPAQSAA